ncbi:SET and MYND domain-containing protein 4-like isoform X2 [Prorops nasuta]|uniref:SET and MYND domain-containing protein 4-like isoform X2 n=1 Tax=Prorops nasuta TaxID=863751 RepID=UPI0034CDDDED
MQWQNFLEALNRRLCVSPRFASEVRAKMSNENELMTYLLNDQHVRFFVSLWLQKRNNSKEGKSLEKAKLIKTLGNKEFQGKNYLSSIHSYTKSALYAPADSEDLPVAIANRSAALYYLGKYEDCLKDINLAIELDYPEKLRFKLYLRAVECHLKLGKKKLAEESLQRVHETINKFDDSFNIRKEINQHIEQLTLEVSSMQNDEDEAAGANFSIKPEPAFGLNPNFLSASAGIDRKYSQDKGRYVVANRDIKKGQILFVEKPFAFVLLDHDKSNSLCENCCRSYGDVPVPCTQCSDTFYCSVECSKEGWSSFHRWECAGCQMGLWQQIGIAHLALKVLVISTTTSDIITFNEVQKLVTNFDKLSPSDLIIYGITATMLTLYLSKYTDYFKSNDIKQCLVDKFCDGTSNFDHEFLSDDDKRVYISSLLLRHILQLVSNGHAITKLNTVASEKDKVATEQQDRVATAIYPSASMMNHSCDPSIINSFMDQHLIVKATKDIAAGEEVFHCYGPHFRRMSKDQRQEILKNQYCFTCTCEPCTSPELQFFVERFRAKKCPECSGALYAINSHSLHCLDCGAVPNVNYQAELDEAQDFFDAGQVYIDLEREKEALDILKICLNKRRNVLYKYHEDITVTLDLIGKVYAIMGRWLESISYLEHSLTAIEERYGSSSIELANELNKVTDVCIRYLQEEPNTTTKWYKNTLKKTRRYLDRAEEIMNLNYGPWNGSYEDINDKKKTLSTLLKDFNI